MLRSYYSVIAEKLLSLSTDINIVVVTIFNQGRDSVFLTS